MSLGSSGFNQPPRGNGVLVLPTGHRIPLSSIASYDYNITTAGVLTIFVPGSYGGSYQYTPNDPNIALQIDIALNSIGSSYFMVDFSAAFAITSYSPNPVSAAAGGLVTLTGTGFTDLGNNMFLRNSALGFFKLTYVNATTMTVLFPNPAAAASYSFDFVYTGVIANAISITFA